MNKEFHSLIINLKQRRGMYVFDDSYNSLSSFLIGYLLARETHSEHQISNQFQEWLWSREKKHFSLHWTSYVLNEMANGDENQACDLILDLFEEFLK